MNGSDKVTEYGDVDLLVEKVRNGDQATFSELVERYAPLIEALVFKFYDGDIVGLSKDDMRQEARLRFYNAILTYDAARSDVGFGLYAKICISNALVSQLRLHKKHSAEQPSIDPLEGALDLDEAEDPSGKILEEERVRALYSLIRKNLSAYEYRIWNLYMSGLTAKDIGGIVGSDEKSVGNAVYRIRKKLRALLI